tara:strand:+ start:1182 stop:1301 length:120 start_codon:yes stop_codon:yes gene_type:complete
MIKTINKELIKASAKGKTNEFSTRKKIGIQTKSERNKYV